MKNESIFAVSSRAPRKIWVLTDYFVHRELLEFAVAFLGDELSQVTITDFILALFSRAFDRNLAVSDLKLAVLLDTLSVEDVATNIKWKHIVSLEPTETDLARVLLQVVLQLLLYPLLSCRLFFTLQLLC